MVKKKIVFTSIVLILVGAGVVYGLAGSQKSGLISPEANIGSTPTPTQVANITISATPTASPTATPTPKPLTFAEMNARYGPCAQVPVLMYHHIQNLDVAKEHGYQSLTVTPDWLQKQLGYLKDRGYNSIDPAQLIAFFDQGSPLPKKPILLTFDDGYDDFATYAAPLLSQFSFKGTMFLPTGLLENPGYLKWSTITGLTSQGIYFGNHTWSHQNMGANLATDKREISTAATQLSDHGLDQLKVFAYPYGIISDQAVKFLADTSFRLAFTTKPGSIQCKAQRLTLTRTRIGNTGLSAYGL